MLQKPSSWNHINLSNRQKTNNRIQLAVNTPSCYLYLLKPKTADGLNGLCSNDCDR